MLASKKRSDSYWKKRFELKEKSRDKENKKYQEELKQEYRKALETIQEDITVFYAKYAKNNTMTFAEARKVLSKTEINDKQEKIREYTEALIKGDSILFNDLDILAAKAKLNRLEGLYTDVAINLKQLEDKFHLGMTEHLKKSFANDYYESIYLIQQGIGIGSSFSKVPNKLIEETLAYPWSGDTFSNRIWGNNKKLADVLKRELIQGFIRGDSLAKMVNHVAKKMDKSYKDAARLVNTEAAFICNTASLTAYKECSIERFEFLATLDDKTSAICGEMDGKVFLLTEALTGKNLPPLHVNCRSTTVPYFDDAYDARIARTGKKTYIIPGNMRYEDWSVQYGPNAWVKNKQGKLVNKDTGEIKED